MMYGEENHVLNRVHSAATETTALALEAGAAVIFTRDVFLPGMVLYWGYKPTVTFAYDTLTAQGILTLWRYTKTIQTAVLGNAAGTGYAVGDLLSVTQAGASGGILRVLTVNAGLVVTVEIVNAGINYRGAANLATVAMNGAGDNAFTVTITDRKSLDTMQLENGAILGKLYMRRVPNAISDVSPSGAPPASYKAGEQLVVEITTAATGGVAIAGDFQPIIIVQNRGENFAAQPLWVQADIGTVVSPAIPNY
jgi:hypothetical protein